MGAQISAPLLWATPMVEETGTRERPLLLKLYGFSSWVLAVGVPWRYGALNTLTCSWRKRMYSIASRRTEAVSVFPNGETSCCRATIRSPSFSFLSFVEKDKSVLCRFDGREVILLWSTEQGLRLCSVIFLTSIPSSPENVAPALQKELTIILWSWRQCRQIHQNNNS